jgi:alpha-methylacyl-CoA racemase
MRALDDLTVLELAFYYPGPLCGLILSDMGARVVKVESPDGDPMRLWGATAHKTHGDSFRMLNRGKKSVVLDLKERAGRDAFLSLVARSDVLLQVFRPAVMERLGLGAETIRQASPRIVHCLITGFGATGPYSGRAGHDLNYQSLAGITSLTGTASGEPAIPGSQAADLSGALTAALAIVAAIRERDRTGEGRFIDISLTEGAVLANALNLLGSRVPAEESRPGGLLLIGRFPAYNLYRSSDGRWFALGAIEPKFWVAFCIAAGREDLAGLQYDPSAVGRVRKLFASRDAPYWERLSRENDVCLEPVLSREEVLDHPLHEARGIFKVKDGGTTHIRIPGLPQPSGRKLDVPELGEHTSEVLDDLLSRKT